MSLKDNKKEKKEKKVDASRGLLEPFVYQLGLLKNLNLRKKIAFDITVHLSNPTKAHDAEFTLMFF